MNHPLLYIFFYRYNGVGTCGKYRKCIYYIELLQFALPASPSANLGIGFHHTRKQTLHYLLSNHEHTPNTGVQNGCGLCSAHYY